MITINEKVLEVDKIELLDSTFAVFIIEFDYDNRMYVGHTFSQTVKTAIRKFINNTLDESIRSNPLLVQSMKNSNTLYIAIREPNNFNLDELFKLKYDCILNSCSYEPYGFNKLNIVGKRRKEEKKYMLNLLKKLPDYKAIENNNTKIRAAGRAIIEYKYIKHNGYTKIAEWPSATEAAKHYGISPSNITACCSGRLHTAYGRIWRYAD